MWASGAIAYDHSMSSVASPDQFAAADGPETPLLKGFEKSGWPFGKTCSKLGSGRLG